MRRNTLVLLIAVVAGSSLTGCGFLHSHFGKKDVEYRKAVQEHPLEVPPDLDTPSSSGALVVPSVSASTPAAGTATASPSAAAPTAAPPPSTAVAGVSLGGDGLQVTDSVENTWSRVGLALERSGAATILSRDEAGRAYTVETTGHTISKPGWFKRAITLGHAGNKQTAKVQLTVHVSADGSGSKVNVEGAGDEASRDAARSLLATLRQRLS
ncbi:MAG: hypothetical protein ACHP7D_02860 [Lysobacterales bacterium]